MSDALKYLAQARPEAMTHYFAFLKDCGKHLSPETRCLISVITKVDAQTERGFRQYLKRALDQGSTPVQVLDALLMAFPTLGLTKIVWAVDIILAMGLPGFDVASLGAQETPGPASAASAPSSWHDLGATRSFKIGQTRAVQAHGRSLLVHRGTDGWAVFDSRCPHQGTVLTVNDVQGQRLSCPNHGWAFELGSGGRCTVLGNPGLKRWPSSVQAGRLVAQW